ncbi:MAG: hypothetical protein JWP27_461 [Flaviaesturariibacter sp.]|nr:hypothetical protein [Flaviaesturariibacter sp.]
MEDNLNSLELDTLKRMHQSAAFRMQAALLSGSSWEDVREHREMVTELAIAIHRKEPAYFLNPAESPRRSSPSDD